MRANVRILEFMVNYWDHEMGMFNLQGETLELTVEDIYFITGLSRRGAPVNLEGTGRGHPLKCPKLCRHILYIGYSEERKQRSNCRHPGFYSPGIS